jgi:hypothetical protein
MLVKSEVIPLNINIFLCIWLYSVSISLSTQVPQRGVQLPSTDIYWPSINSDYMAACLDQNCVYLQATTLHEIEITTAVTFSQID